MNKDVNKITLTNPAIFGKTISVIFALVSKLYEHQSFIREYEWLPHLPQKVLHLTMFGAKKESPPSKPNNFQLKNREFTKRSLLK